MNPCRNDGDIPFFTLSIWPKVLAYCPVNSCVRDVTDWMFHRSPWGTILARFNHKCRTTRTGKAPRVETLAPAASRWSQDGWRSAHDIETSNSGLGVLVADLPTTDLPSGTTVVFTFYWPERGNWEDTNFEIRIADRSLTDGPLVDSKARRPIRFRNPDRPRRAA